MTGHQTGAATRVGGVIYGMPVEQIFHQQIGYQYHKDYNETEIKIVKRNREWFEKGYFPADVATNDNLEALHKAGKVFTRMNRYLPGAEAKFTISNNFDVIVIPTGEAVINRLSIRISMSACVSLFTKVQNMKTGHNNSM